MREVRMFVNGQALRGGSLHHALENAEFLGAVHTAPKYRFYAFNHDFPGLRFVSEGGAAIPGELYRLTYAQLREQLLPGEPAELELSVIELEDGEGSLSMVVRPGAWEAKGVIDITQEGGWRRFRGIEADG